MPGFFVMPEAPSLAVPHAVQLAMRSRPFSQEAAHSGMPHWQDPLFIRLSRSANDATDYFQLPTGRVGGSGDAGHDPGA